MASSIRFLFFSFLVISIFSNCKENNTVINNSQPNQEQEPVKLIPIYQLGDSLTNFFLEEERFEETEIVIDSTMEYKIGFSSSYYLTPSYPSLSFIRLKVFDDVKLLDNEDEHTIDRTPMSTPNRYEKISIYAGEWDWLPRFGGSIDDTGWIKFSFYDPMAGANFHTSWNKEENFVVFKFGEENKERMGWMNIIYRDTICFVKEGYYQSYPTDTLIVGKK